MGRLQHVREAPNESAHVHFQPFGPAFDNVGRQLEKLLRGGRDHIPFGRQHRTSRDMSMKETGAECGSDQRTSL